MATERRSAVTLTRSQKQHKTFQNNMGRRGHRPCDGWIEPAPAILTRSRDNTSHRGLCVLAAKWLQSSVGALCKPRCQYAAVELVTAGTEQTDVFGWNYWTTVMIEVKVSRSDFLADAKKPHRQNPSDGVGRLRYYCCPSGLIRENDLPPYWGLLWEQEGKIVVVKSAEPQPSSSSAEVAILTSIMRREGIKPQVFDYRKTK